MRQKKNKINYNKNKRLNQVNNYDNFKVILTTYYKNKYNNQPYRLVVPLIEVLNDCG